MSCRTREGGGALAGVFRYERPRGGALSCATQGRHWDCTVVQLCNPDGAAMSCRMRVRLVCVWRTTGDRWLTVRIGPIGPIGRMGGTPTPSWLPVRPIGPIRPIRQRGKWRPTVPLPVSGGDPREMWAKARREHRGPRRIRRRPLRPVGAPGEAPHRVRRTLHRPRPQCPRGPHLLTWAIEPPLGEAPRPVFWQACCGS